MSKIATERGIDLSVGPETTITEVHRLVR
jgi:hypothetical protein